MNINFGGELIFTAEIVFLQYVRPIFCEMILFVIAE